MNLFEIKCVELWTAQCTLLMLLFSRWTDNIFSIQEWVKRKFPAVDQVRATELL